MIEDEELFDSAEEVWFWFCRCLEARGDGLRSRTDYPGKKRNVEISDIYRIIKRMRIHHHISNRELRVMSKWGALGCSPYYSDRAKGSEIKLWEQGLKAFEIYLKDKRII